jgi:hypothetical protein
MASIYSILPKALQHVKKSLLYKHTNKTKTKIKTNKQTKTNKRILMYQWYFERVYVQHAV